MTASPCDHGQLPAILVLVCLSVSSVWLVKNQKFTRECTKQTKMLPGVQLFYGQFFSMDWLFFDDPAGYEHA